MLNLIFNIPETTMGKVNKERVRGKPQASRTYLQYVFIFDE